MLQGYVWQSIMIRDRIENYTRGWFIGNFEPSLYKTEAVEIAVKSYLKGDFEEKHFHKIATEFTLIIAGKVQMNSKTYSAGDIIQIDKYDSTDFLI